MTWPRPQLQAILSPTVNVAITTKQVANICLLNSYPRRNQLKWINRACRVRKKTYLARVELASPSHHQILEVLSGLLPCLPAPHIPMSLLHRAVEFLSWPSLTVNPDSLQAGAFKALLSDFLPLLSVIHSILKHWPLVLWHNKLVPSLGPLPCCSPPSLEVLPWSCPHVHWVILAGLGSNTSSQRDWTWPLSWAPTLLQATILLCSPPP
jgi:hypothetical protein